MTALLAAQTLPLAAEESQRYLIAPRKQSVSASRLRVATTAIADDERHRLSAYDNVKAYAADLTAGEADALRRSSDWIVEPVVPRYAESDVTSLPPFAAADAGAASTQDTPWGIAAVNAPAVWPVTTGANVNVVVVDTGIDPQHPELTHAYAGGYNSLKPGQPVTDGHRHGTHVAGTIAAANNDVGVVGVAPGVKLWVIKALGDDGEGTSESIIAAFNWTIEKAKASGGRWVMNLSLGSTLYSEVEALAVSEATEAGIIIVAAAGNLGMDLVKYPAAHHGAIAVGAVNEALERAPFSGFGRELKIMAPGADVRSTIIHGHDYSVGVRSATGTPFDAWRVNGSPFVSVTGLVFDCGVGDPEQFPAAVRGNIAWIRRGKYKFREMARNAKNAGAVAMIIQNYSTDSSSTNQWTFYPDPPDPTWDGFEYPLAVGMRHDKAASLLEQPGPVTLTYSTNIYGKMNGTSMATPHVAGAAALLLSLVPDLNVAEVEYALRVTARDLETRGWNYETGWGMLDALKAAQWVAAEKFGVPQPAPPSPGRRRSVR
jgi:serine protease